MKTNVVETIKERLDIVEFVRQYVPHLRKAGKTWKACCPFHKEKTPSFTVSSEKGLYYCFGCQEGGDIFAFLMKIENLSFNEAVRKLADAAGVEYQPLTAMSGDEQRRVDARKLLDFTRKFYHKNLMSAGGESVRDYVKNRNLTKETVTKFELGFAKNDSTALCTSAQQAGYTPEALKAAGLCVITAYGARDYFRGRLMFPIINQRGEPVGFGGRILGDGEPKYLNSPETLLFSKSKVLYGLNFAGPAIRRTGRAILLEGYMDVIACHQAGVDNTIAPLGTSLTPEHARLLKRYTDEVVVLFDPDAAGIKAALRGALILIEQGLFVKVASLSEGLDPDEFIAKYGREKFDAVLNNARDLIEFHTKLTLELYEKPLKAQDKTQIVSELAETINQQPDEIVRREWITYVAQQVGVDEMAVIGRRHEVQPQPNRYQFKKPATPSKAVSAPNNTAEENLVTWLLKYPAQLENAENAVEYIESATLQAILNTLTSVRQASPQTDDLTQAVIDAQPALKSEIIRLCVLEVPESFEPARDIMQCYHTLAKAALNRRLAVVQKKMKSFGSAPVPPELLKQFLELQSKLKNQR